MTAAAALAAVLLVSGCAGIDPYAHEPMAAHLRRADAVGDCAWLLRQLDARVDALGVRDAAAPRVPGFPYLRVDRFSESLGAAAAELRGAGFAAWSELMEQADRQARAAELANADETPLTAAVDACRYALAVADAGELARLRESARVPDDYSSLRRAVGLYPLTRLAFAAGIGAWQQRTRDVFARPLEQLTPAGRLRRYRPAAAPPVVAAPPRSAAFALPAPARAALAELILRHAPALEVETASDDDRIGTLHWDGAPPRLAVDSAAPAAYVRAAYTHFGGRVRLQLVYTFWFPARPAEHAFDLLAGHLDALLWRVTLDEHGAALLYDSIHACGCYHLFFPTTAVAIRPQPETLDEGLFAPQPPLPPAADRRVVLRLQSRTHHLQRVLLQSGDDHGAPYVVHDDDALRRLPWPGSGTRSAYDPAGLVPGSERAERWLFWPMGIASAGQMRQWGRHATAFVGRRHFDDPRLLDRYFTPAPLSPPPSAAAAADASARHP